MYNKLNIVNIASTVHCKGFVGTLGASLLNTQLGLSQICSKICPNAFGNFPKFLSVMFFMLPIMLVLSSNMNNTDVKILLLKCSIRVFMI